MRAVLDLACGAGRHSRLLCERWWTVGLDLIRGAAPSRQKRVCRMRPSSGRTCVSCPSPSESFDLVVNLFTSFGYFEDDSEHVRVLGCLRDVDNDWWNARDRLSQRARSQSRTRSL